MMKLLGGGGICPGGFVLGGKLDGHIKTLFYLSMESKWGLKMACESVHNYPG